MDQLAALARPVLILAGGEPLYQPDIYELGLRYDPHARFAGRTPLCSIRKRRPWTSRNLPLRKRWKAPRQARRSVLPS
jgi:hypothetical protein